MQCCVYSFLHIWNLNNTDSAVQVVSEASLTADGFLSEDGSGVVVGLQDLAELESACLATTSGDVVLFNLNTCQVCSTEKLES